jgi:gamma-glutamylcyclotransferase (GGCT)/AIG2-like uncharacterized protein YtfP
MQDCLFAYGTLRPGLTPKSVQPLVRQLQWLGGGSAPGRLYDLGDYPGAVFDPSAETRVVGDVLVLPEDAASLLKQLDDYEGFSAADIANSLFVRFRIDVKLADGREIDCWAYRYHREVGRAPLVAAGDYAQRAKPG